MKRVYKLIKVLFKVSVLKSISYRGDFIFGLFSSVIWLGVPIIFFRVIYLSVDKIAGWTFQETLLLVGVYTLIDGLMMALLVNSMPSLEEDIRDGTLDTILLQPINPQIYYLLHSVDFTQLISSFLGLAVIMYAIPVSNLNLMSITCFILSCISGCCIYYSLWFLWTITAFWFPTNFGRSDLFLSVIQIGRYPSSIFKGAGKFLFNFILPVGLIATPAVEVLLDKNVKILIFQLVITSIFILLDIVFWKLGVRKYDGAGR